MAKFPLLPALKVINALICLGYSIDNQKGSHVVLKNSNEQRTIVVPDHPELDRGTLKAILKQAGIYIEDLLSVLAGLVGADYLITSIVSDELFVPPSSGQTKNGSYTSSVMAADASEIIRSPLKKIYDFSQSQMTSSQTSTNLC